MQTHAIAEPRDPPPTTTAPADCGRSVDTTVEDDDDDDEDDDAARSQRRSAPSTWGRTTAVRASVNGIIPSHRLTLNATDFQVRSWM